jgi:hypothetical protein
MSIGTCGTTVRQFRPLDPESGGFGGGERIVCNGLVGSGDGHFLTCSCGQSVQQAPGETVARGDDVEADYRTFKGKSLTLATIESLDGGDNVSFGRVGTLNHISPLPSTMADATNAVMSLHLRALPAGFIAPCLPSPTRQPPSGELREPDTCLSHLRQWKAPRGRKYIAPAIHFSLLAVAQCYRLYQGSQPAIPTVASSISGGSGGNAVSFSSNARSSPIDMVLIWRRTGTSTSTCAAVQYLDAGPERPSA